MKKEKTGVIITIIVVVIALALIGWVSYSLTSSKACGASNGNIDVHFYDANGNPICNIQSLSVVGLTPTTGARGVASMSLTIKASNGGAIPLSCNIYKAQVNGADGTVFDTAMTRADKFLQVSQTAEWTSNLFTVSGFEATPTPDVFNVTIRCTYSDVSGQKIIDSAGSIPLYITADGTGSFTVVINPPEGIPTLYCGDGTCSASIGETASTCPQDCASIGNVFFRSTDLTYVLGSAIAYTGTCGSALTKYGYDSASCRSETSTSCPVITGYTQLLSAKTIPDAISTWVSISPCLYSTSSGLSMLFKVASTSGEPTSCPVGQWIELRYTTASSYASSVSNLASSFNNLKEVSCP